MNTAIYILSDGSSANEKYKVGSHTGTLEKLENRYITALPEVKIHYFIKTSRAKEIESIVKKLYSGRRVINIHGSSSEWILASIHEILCSILMLIHHPNVNLSDTKSSISIDVDCSTATNVSVTRYEGNSQIKQTNKFRDTVQIFLDEDTIAKDQEGYRENWTSGAECYNRYELRCKSNGSAILSNKNFGVELKARLGGKPAKGRTWKISNGVKYLICLTNNHL